MSATYTLYGSYASYYTAKTRAYLRKKGIPFVERLPSDPKFRNQVRPASGSHRIPQLLAPDGVVVQDSVEIQDYLEARFKQLPAIPSTPKQRAFVHLMELLASEGLVRLAWLHRWVFAENLDFVISDFGRSFKPQGSDEELKKYGQLIADRMMSYGLPESTPELRAELDRQYQGLLRLFERHLIEHPYFLGGHPSAADYAIMGALHAHLGRDPAGLRVMQQVAPRVFRWVEHMNVSAIQSPEFFHRPIEFCADDEVPETALSVLRFISAEYAEPFLLGSLAFNQAMCRAGGSGVISTEHDQPELPTEQVSYGDVTRELKASLHPVWLAQRSQRFFQSLPGTQRTQVTDMLADALLNDLISVPVDYKLERVDNRLVVA